MHKPWIIGLEPGDPGQGALLFARWLRQTLHDRVLGVHVRELWTVGLAQAEAATYLAASIAETDQWLEQLRPGAADAAVDGFEIVESMGAESGLAEASRGAPGLVVGRRVAREGAWVRLGGVVRRLLRQLPAPVIVAPPELDAGAFEGPVLLATAVDGTSVAAARYAAWFARRVGRPLVCVHIGQPRWVRDVVAAQPQSRSLRDAYRATTERQARAWVDEHCPGAALVLDYGDPAELLPAIAARRQASLLVVGSGRPGLAERIFAGSTATLTAAAAPCAVAVVPPDVDLDALA